MRAGRARSPRPRSVHENVTVPARSEAGVASAAITSPATSGQLACTRASRVAGAASRV